MSRWSRVVLIGIACQLLVPAAASAATRYTSPTGDGIACTLLAPCTFSIAVGGASNGDTIQLVADEYNLDGVRIDVGASNLIIQGPGPVGDASTFIPYLLFGSDHGTGIRLWLNGANPTLRNLAISGEGQNALVATGGANPQVTLDRVIISNTSSTGGIAFEGDGATITNSIIRHDGDSATGRALEATGTLTGSLVYARNGRAISLQGSFHRPGFCTLVVRNTLAWGASSNLWLEGAAFGSGDCSPVTADVDHSWIPRAGGAGATGGGLTLVGATDFSEGTRNLPDMPVVFDPTEPGSSYLGSYVLPSSSPAFNAGCTEGCGTHDYYGRPRPIGAANDIGPTETMLAPTTSAVSWSNLTSSSATLSATLNPNGAATTYVFAVRRVGEAAWTALPLATAPIGATPVTVSGDVTGLVPSTEYELRVTATNEVGSVSDATGRMTTGARLTVTGTRARVTARTVVVEAKVRVTAPGRIVMRVTSGTAKKRTWCTTRKTAPAAKRYSLRCNLGPKARAAVRKGRLKLTVRTAFTPTVGIPLAGDIPLTVNRTP